MEDKLIPYHATLSISANSVVVFAPHPDDEVFGCGGAILRHVASAVPVHVVILSDGAFNAKEEEHQALTETREAESRKAAVVLGYGEPEFWRLPDRGVIYGEALIRRIMDEIRKSAANLIYAPSLLEMHPDHRAVAMCVIEAVRRAPSKPLLALYEVGAPLAPNLLLDISDLAERKMEAMKCFVSQNEKQRYDLDIAALNRYRTYTLPAEVTAAEAYILISSEELYNDPLKLYQSEHKRQRELGLALDATDVPLISVIIRSMDRPTLSEALDSLALQTYPNIEVVLVNAKGLSHRDAGSSCGRFPLRMVGQNEPLSHSRAANLGLENAVGEYLIFLDDDDWFEPHHIAALQIGFRDDDAFAAVYAAVRCINECGEETRLFEEEFDWTQLRIDNFIPIHAVLFRRRIVDAGARFDETLDVCEDWDFWLQVAEHGSFRFLPEVGATYRVHSQLGSGVWNDLVRTRQAMTTVYRKWMPRWSDDILWSIFEYARYKRLLSQADRMLREAGVPGVGFSDLIAGAAELQTKYRLEAVRSAAMQRQIEAIYTSTSWRLTAPLRLANSMVRWVLAVTQQILQSKRLK